MFLQKIKKICKSSREIVVVHSEKGDQWFGTRAVLYRIDGLELSPGTVELLFDSKNIEGEYDFKTFAKDIFEARGISFEDSEPSEGYLLPVGMYICDWNSELAVLMYNGGAVMINSDYLAPLKDCENLSLFLRCGDVIGSYVVAKNGFGVVAVFPTEEITAWASEQLHRVELSVAKSSWDYPGLRLRSLLDDDTYIGEEGMDCV